MPTLRQMLRGWVDNQLHSLGYMKQGEDTSSPGGRFLYAGEVGTGGLSTDALYDLGWGRQKLEQAAMSHPVLFSDFNFIMQEFARASLEVVRKVGENEFEPVENHELESLLAIDMPNDYVDDSFLFAYTVGWYLVRREAYWLLNKNRVGGLAEILPIPSDRIVPIPSGTNIFDGFAYQPKTGDKPIRLPPDRVMYWRGVNLFSYHRGFGLHNVYRVPLETDIGAALWNRDTFEKGLTLQTVLSVPRDLSDSLYDQAVEDIREATEDAKRRYIILRADSVKSDKISMTHTEADYLPGRELNSRELDRLVGFPAGFWDKQASYASSEVARAQVYHNVIDPLLTSLAKKITKQVLWRYWEDRDLRAKFKSMKPVDSEEMRQDEKHVWAIKTLKEARADRGWAPMEGALEVLNDYLVPLATNPQFVTAILGMGSPAPAAEGQVAATGQEQKGIDLEAAERDLWQWRRLALKRLGAEESPAYDFKSEHLPGVLAENVFAELHVTEFADEVNLVFERALAELKAIVFEPKGNEAPVLDKPEDVEITEVDIGRAVDVWNASQPAPGPKLISGFGLPDAVSEEEEAAEEQKQLRYVSLGLLESDNGTLEVLVEEHHA